MKTIKLFFDGAEITEIEKMRKNPLVDGFTTNPSLMRKAGISDYMKFVSTAVEIVFPKPISFEIFADEPIEMIKQAKVVSNLSSNIYVKIPITNTRGLSTKQVVAELNKEGISTNVTAIMTLKHFKEVAEGMDGSVPNILSIFAGRIADTGVDPIPIMVSAKQLIQERRNLELLWASPREILNLVQAKACGCDIITMTHDLWSKSMYLGKNLEDFSLETVKMFYEDAKASEYAINTSE